MSAFNSALLEMEQIVRDAKEVPRLENVQERAKLVLRLRTRNIAQVSAMIQALKTDARFVANPDDAKACSQRLLELRQKLAALQTSWPAAAISEKFDRYMLESNPVARECKEFVRWAKEGGRRP